MDQPGNTAGGMSDGTHTRSRGGEDAPGLEGNVSKKMAQQGQWRTPPLPAFATFAAGAGAATPSAGVPTTPDEYARMLQEAYKRGAEAGLRAQQPSHPAGVAVATSGGIVASQYAAPPTRAPHAHANSLAHANHTVHANHSIPSAVPAAAAPEDVGAPAAKPPPAVPHSQSMPDLFRSSQAEEEDKRKKRLARNRSSARLRRLKKKNLVDSYEGEVGTLEAALAKLRAHRWGAGGGDHEALIEALSMDRGQRPLTPAARKDFIQAIVAQQQEQVQNLLDCQTENWLLCALGDAGGAPLPAGEGAPASGDELAQASAELQGLLRLTPDQRALLGSAAEGCAREVRDLFTVEDCLRSLHDNRWLLDEGADGVAAQFTNVLNQAQLSKFLVWSDHNAEAIERLDYVNVPEGAGDGPVFEFGVEGGTDGE